MMVSAGFYLRENRGKTAFRRRFAAFCLALLACPAIAAAEPVDPTASARFIERQEEGWFWYEEPPEPPAEPEPEPEPETAAAPPPAPVQPAALPSAPPPAGPPPLSAAWLEANMKSYQIRATDDPSPVNVRAYLLLQRLAIEKAEAFADAVQAQTLGNPLLDSTFERPIAPFATKEMDAAAYRARIGLVRLLARDTGFLFFFSGDCPLCAAQAPVLAAIERNTGFAVLPVSLDGAPLAEGVFSASYTADQGQAAMLGVSAAPALFLMRADGALVQIAAGPVEANDLINRILVIARREGWISEEAFAATRAVRARPGASLSPPDPSVADDPAALVAWLEGTFSGARP